MSTIAAESEFVIRDPRDELFGHPKGVYVCFFTEMWERFSFYGMKALLLLYLLQHHKFGDKSGLDVLGAYGGLVYSLPVIGGLLADRYLGMRKAVIFGGLLLVCGHFGMAFEGNVATVAHGVVTRDEASLTIFYLSLALIIMPGSRSDPMQPVHPHPAACDNRHRSAPFPAPTASASRNLYSPGAAIPLERTPLHLICIG